MAIRKSSFHELRSLGEKVLNNSIQNISSVDNCSSSQSDILKINKLDIEASDKNAENILQRDDFSNAFFIAPISCSKLVDMEDGDGENYWTEAKPKLIERISKIFGFRYGIDFAILRRGLFSLLVILTRKDGKWHIDSDVLDFIVPDRADVFFRTLDYYFMNTDSEFFPINAIVASNDMSDGSDVFVEEFENTEVKTLQVDITFLRSDSFYEYDMTEGRKHLTKNLFRDGLMHSLAMQYRIMSFDDEIVDAMISGKLELDEDNEDTDEDEEFDGE